MKGLVLSAGFGTRLKPITDVIPKALVPVCGIPLMEVALRTFRKNGIDDLAVNIHYMPDLMEIVLDALPYHVKRFYEKEILGTGGALFNARDYLREQNAFCVANADIIHNAPIKNLAEKFRSSGEDIVLIGSNLCGNKVMGITDDNSYAGRTDALFSRAVRATAFTGIAFYRSAVAEIFRRDDFDVKVIWKRALESGFSVKVWDFDNITWFDTGTIDDLKECYWAILDKKIPFDFPLGMDIDFERRIAVPLDCNYKIPQDAQYLWLERLNSQAINASRSIFWSGSKVEPQKTYENALVIPWGEV